MRDMDSWSEEELHFQIVVLSQRLSHGLSERQVAIQAMAMPKTADNAKPGIQSQSFGGGVDSLSLSSIPGELASRDYGTDGCPRPTTRG